MTEPTRYQRLAAWHRRQSEEPMPKIIPLTECVKGHVYELKSRNLTVGLFDGETGFIGIREKMGSTYLFTEYHYDTGSPFGTVRPLRRLGLFEWTGDFREGCRVENGEPMIGGEILHTDDGHARWCQNQAMFDWLIEIEKPILEQNRRVQDSWDAGYFAACKGEEYNPPEYDDARLIREEWDRGWTSGLNQAERNRLKKEQDGNP